eukprot:XP_011670759.1 PREDICTED: alpha-1,3-mannosyl-glycoprotein 4-beta-N-acetylglucosaminyltransferase C-like [Strongylocentrotus purpuratus]
MVQKRVCPIDFGGYDSYHGALDQFGRGPLWDRRVSLLFTFPHTPVTHTSVSGLRPAPEAARRTCKTQSTSGCDFLTIGLPTVLRETDNYLSQTLDSLILNSSPEERSAAILLIFLADFEDEKRSILRDMIKDKYLPYLESGFIQVIQAPASFYPSLKNLKSNYGDSETRVRWRSKQCVDIAYTFIYGSGLSEYYLHMEDDVITVKGYITAIRTYIREKSNVKWVILEFASLGTFGQLLRAYDLDRLAQFILFFYQDQPVDWLFSKFKDLNAQQKKYIRKPSIFQHKGIQSSLKGKNMAHWVDKTFIDTNKASGKNQSSGKV